MGQRVNLHFEQINNQENATHRIRQKWRENNQKSLILNPDSEHLLQKIRHRFLKRKHILFSNRLHLKTYEMLHYNKAIFSVCEAFSPRKTGLHFEMHITFFRTFHS